MANAANAGEAIPGLRNDIGVTHVLRSENFDDPADLARLPAVSHAMRDAVVETGIQFEDIDEEEAVALGRLSVLKRLQRQGRLSRPEYLCQAAARSGQLEKLKEFGGEERTAREVEGVSREPLPMERSDVRGGGIRRAPRGAAVGARERRTVGLADVHAGGGGRAPRGAAVGARERLPVGKVYVPLGGC